MERRSLKKKKSGLQRDSNPWPPRYRCDALPTELWSHTLGARSIYWVHIFPCSEMTGKTLLIKLDPLLIGKITKIQSEIFRMILISVLWCMLLVKLSSWRAIRFLYVSVLKNLINMKLRLESKTRYSRNFITFHLCWMTNAVINFFEIQTFERDPSSRMLLCTICYRLSLRCLLFSWTYRNGLYCLGNFL